MDPHSTIGGYPCFEAYLPVQCMTPTPGQTRPRELVGKTRSISAGGLEILLPESLPLRTPLIVRVGDGAALCAYVVSVHQSTPTIVGTIVPHRVAFEQPVDQAVVVQWMYRSGRQSHARAPVRFAVEYVQAGTAGHGTCLNLSRGGMFIATPSPAPPGSQVSLTFNLPTLSHTFSVLANVVWMRQEEREPNGTTGMGVRFLDPKPSEGALIGSIVNRLCGAAFPPPGSPPIRPPPR
ncbi:MAG: TIGR02266 family protein [Candidatus Methylomirabilales bacterium]